MNTDKTVVVVAAALQVLSTAAGMLFLQSCEETTKRDLHVIIIYVLQFPLIMLEIIVPHLVGGWGSNLPLMRVAIR